MKSKKPVSVLFLFLPVMMLAQPTSSWFDFGSESASKGYIRITWRGER